MTTANATRIANIYAGTLLDLARQSQAVEAVAADLETVAALQKQQSQFRAFLASPYFAEQTKGDLVRKVFRGKVHGLTLNFLSVMIDHERGAFLPAIIARFRQLFRKYQGYEPVAVTVARPLGPAQLDKLSQDLAEALNAKVDLDVQVDPSILGGVIIRYGEEMLDNSVRGRLTRTIYQLTNPQKRQK